MLHELYGKEFCSVVSDSLRPCGLQPTRLLCPWDSPSMGFSRQEYWSGLPFPFPGDLPDPGIEPRSPAMEADALTSEPPGKPNLPAIQETWVLSLGQEDPLEKRITMTPVFLPGEFHGQKSLVGYSPSDHKMSDKTEWLTHTKTYTHMHTLDKWGRGCRDRTAVISLLCSTGKVPTEEPP